MAISSTTEWRIRAGGNDANGSAYDSAQSGVISTTLNGAITNSATSITVASASGWPSSGNYYARLGPVGAEGTDGLNEVVLVTGGQGTTTWTVTRGQLGTTATAFASGVVVDNNLARCNTAAFSGTDGTSNASTTFTSASATFNATVVGNHLRLASGTNGTTGYYRITGYTDANTITLDRNCSTAAMTNGAWKIGGAAATVGRLANGNATGDKPVNANYVYFRGSGSNSPSSADYSISGSSHWTATQGDARGTGKVRYYGEYGYPLILSTATLVNGAQGCHFENIWFKCNTSPSLNNNAFISTGEGCSFFNCKIDGNNQNARILLVGARNVVAFCWITQNTTATPTAGTAGWSLVRVENTTTVIICCLIENARENGIGTQQSVQVINCLIRGCTNDGISNSNNGTPECFLVYGNVITNNAGNGINFTGTNMGIYAQIANNVITDHTGASKSGLAITAGSPDSARGIVNYNAFFNNTANYSVISAGANDRTCGVSPFVNSAGGDYTLNDTASGGKELRDGGLPGIMPGLSTTDVYSPIGLLGTPPVFIAPSGLIARNIGTY